MYFTARVVSSLEKVFCKPELSAERMEHFSGARGETVSFQIAFKSDDNYSISFEVESELRDLVTLREVGLVPCMMPAMPDDPFIITHDPGVFPDPLLPLVKPFRMTRGNWHAVWVSVKIPRSRESGVYDIVFHIRDVKMPMGPYADIARDVRVTLEVLPFVLPEQKLIAVNWFYADCLYSYYRIPCWSERHWELLEAYFRNMAEHGNNVIYTPLWSVPLDTAVGGERPTAQLLEITCENGRYQFDFARLKRWLDCAKRAGIQYVEMSHAFTQWGAEATPKIIVKENGEEVKKFGWHVPADSETYREFLTQLMGKLLPFLRGEGITEKNCFFHVSDEPSETHLDSYCRASGLLRSLIGDYPVIDALSEVEYFHRGLIRRPIPTTNRVDEFVDEPLEQRWVYYCGNWQHGVPNRQFGLPSARNRILGVLLYVYKMNGFLNWGFNFWYTEHSLQCNMDPWKVTDAGNAFCGGGAFVVYPGENGPVDSLHYEVYAEALQDLRALQLLDSLIGRHDTMKLLHEGLDYQLKMTEYPRDSEWLLNLRDRVNCRIVKAQ